MAYSRFDKSDIYSFWVSGNSHKRNDQRLAVWFVPRTDKDCEMPTMNEIPFTTARKMLKHKLFSDLKGHMPKYESELIDIFKQFIADVERSTKS